MHKATFEFRYLKAFILVYLEIKSLSTLSALT